MANKQFTINDIINRQAKGLQLEGQTQTVPVNSDTELVRYEGGETATDRKGNPITPEQNPAQKLLGVKSTQPLKAKKGEPEYGSEWAEDAAQRVWDSGKSMDEVEAEMNKKWPLAKAIIKDNEIAAVRAEDPDKKDDYGKSVQYYEKASDKDGSLHYRSPKEQAEATLARKYGFYLNPDSATAPTNGLISPSSAVSFLHKSNLKKDWENFINLNDINTAEDFLNSYKSLKSKLLDLNGIKSENDLKKLGFNSKEDYDLVTRYLIKSLDEKANSVAASYLKKDESDVTTEVEETAKVEPEPEAVAKTDEVVKPTEPEAKVEETAKVEEPATQDVEPEDNSFASEQARLEDEMSEQEKLVLQEAEEIANREKTEKEAQEADAEIEKAYRKKLQDKFDYEDWLKNPSIISGIFGKSGLSKARRFGLGLSALFAIFGDACQNFARGLTRSTDFKNTAFDELNSTIVKIQNARADKVGVMASKPYETTSENEEKLNKDYEKLRRLPAGAYIPESTLKAFIQESQVDTTSPISEELFNSFNAEAKEGFIDSISKNKKLKSYYLTEDGDLTPAGELQFLNKQEQALNQYRSVLGLSDERIGNIMNLLNLEKERAETRKKVHDVVFSTNADYINSINAMEDETRALVTAKLDFTEARTLDQLLELSNKFRNTVAGLATSTESENDAESLQAAALDRFTEQKGLEKVNEELNKHGWQAELNGEAGAKFPIKIVPISAEISGGGKWSAEQAEKHLQTEYERFSNDYQRSLNKARSSSRASGMSIDQAKDLILNFINTERARGAEADFDAARKNIIDAINNKIQFNQDIINELKEMRKRETRFDTGDNEGVSTANPYVSMFNDVPTKNIEWYKNRLRLA